MMNAFPRQIRVVRSALYSFGVQGSALPQVSTEERAAALYMAVGVRMHRRLASATVLALIMAIVAMTTL